MNRRPIIHVLAMSLILGPLACEEANLALPSESEAEAHYKSSSDLTARVSGNVVELTIDQPIRQVRRGGSLWAKVGPYIYLFSDETETLLREYPGLSGVRVITRTGRDDAEVARAFLHRDCVERAHLETGEKHRREGTDARGPGVRCCWRSSSSGVRITQSSGTTRSSSVSFVRGALA